MNLVFSLAIIQGFIGASDTILYHEWFVKLPRQPYARREQLLHGVRDVLYGLLYLQLGLYRVTGAMAFAIVALLAAEIGITLADFLQEDKTRRLPKGERVMHSVIAIMFGAFIAYYLPVLWADAGLPTGLEWRPHALSPVFVLMGLGALGMAVRDLYSWRRLPVV